MLLFLLSHFFQYLVFGQYSNCNTFKDVMTIFKERGGGGVSVQMINKGYQDVQGGPKKKLLRLITADR